MSNKPPNGHVAAPEKDRQRFMVQLDEKAARALRKIMDHLGGDTRPQAIRWALVRAGALVRAARNLKK